MRFDWKQIRVFISSTFLDMQAERDHLVRFVFPRLRAQLLTKRIHLLDVDLRWGVTDEQDASEVCHEIINQCRPRFLCILGGRYGSTPRGSARSITADEVYFAVLDRALEDRRCSYFYFRDEGATESMVEGTPGEYREPRGSKSGQKLEQLKKDIADAGLRPFVYRPDWDAKTRRLIHLEAFGARVYADLLDSMQHDPELQNRFGAGEAQALDEFEEDEAALDAFVGERIDSYVVGSREGVLRHLQDHAHAESGPSYICVTGPAGIGKTSLLAYLSRQEALGSGGAVVIRHFAGASAGSADPRRAVRRLIRELGVAHPEVASDLQEDGEALRAALRDALREVCARRRVVILLGGIDQFQVEGEPTGVRWLPEWPPENARFILSAAAPSTVLESLRRSLHPREIVLGQLSVGDREAIMERFRKLYGKGLERAQRDALLRKADAGSPLYLRTALEELRTLGPREEIPARIAELPEETRDLFGWILERLERDDGFRDTAGAEIGRELVPRFAALLAASRQGLNQEDLIALLAPGDPMGNVAALMRLLRPHLMWRGELLSFRHGAFCEAARSEYADGERDAQRTLAVHFRGLADPEGKSTWDGSVARAFGELPHHLHEAGMHGELVDVLTSQRYAERLAMLLSREALFDNLEIGFKSARSECSLAFGARLLGAWGRAERVGISDTRFHELADQGRVAEAVRAARTLPPAEAARLLLVGANRALDRGWRADLEAWLRAMAMNSRIVAHCGLREHLRLVERFLGADEPGALNTLVVGRPRDSTQRFLCFLIGTRQLSAASLPRLVEAASRIPDPLWRGFTMLVICLRGRHQGIPATAAAQHLRDDAAAIRGSGRNTMLIEAMSRAYRWVSRAGVEIADLGLSPNDVTGMSRRTHADAAALGRIADRDRTENGSFAFLPAESASEGSGAERVAWTVLRTVARLLDGSGADADKWWKYRERAWGLLAESGSGDETGPLPRGFLTLPEDTRTVVAVSLLRTGELQALAAALDRLCTEAGAERVLPEVLRLISECPGQPGVEGWLAHALVMLHFEANRPGRSVESLHNDPFAPAAAQAAELLARLGRGDEARHWMSWMLARLDPPAAGFHPGGEAGRSLRTNVLLSDVLAGLPSPSPLDPGGPTALEAARLAITMSPRLGKAVCQEYQSPYPPLDYLGARIAAWKAEDAAWTASPPDAFEIFQRCVRPVAVYDEYEYKRSWFLWLLCLAQDPSERQLAACRHRLMPYTRPVFPHELAVSQALWREPESAPDDLETARTFSVLLGRFRELRDFAMTARLATASVEWFREPGEQAEVMALAAEAASRQERAGEAQVYVMTAEAISPGFAEEAQRRVELVQAARRADCAVLATSAGKRGFEDALREAARATTEAGDRVGLLGLTRLLGDCPAMWRTLLPAAGTLLHGAAEAAALADTLMSESGIAAERRDSERRTNA